MLSGYGNTAMRAAAEQAGASLFLTKPISNLALRQAILPLLGAASVGAGGEFRMEASARAVAGVWRDTGTGAGTQAAGDLSARQCRRQNLHADPTGSAEVSPRNSASAARPRRRQRIREIRRRVRFSNSAASKRCAAAASAAKPNMPAMPANSCDRSAMQARVRGRVDHRRSPAAGPPLCASGPASAAPSRRNSCREPVVPAHRNRTLAAREAARAGVATGNALHDRQ